MQKITSRTAVLTAQTCLRKRYLSFHYGETGLAPETVDINLLTGICVHRGLQHLLEHCRIDHPNGDFEEKCIDQAVLFAHETFNESISEHSINLHSSEFNNVRFVIDEHEALIEGLIRAFAIKRLPDLLEEYEVLEVEHEEVYELSIIKCSNCAPTYGFIPGETKLIQCPVCNGSGEQAILFLAKADGLFRRKSDNKLIILSIKTTNEYSENNMDELGNETFLNIVQRNLLHDMQGCSEWVVIQDRLDKAWNRFSIDWLTSYTISELEEWKTKLNLTNQMWNYFISCKKTRPKIYAVQYEHLVTGKRRQSPPNSGNYMRYNFLVHPMRLDQLTSMNFMTKQTNFKPSEYKWKWGSGRQAKGWNKINIWEDIGIKLWIDLLASGKIQPEEGNPLDDLIKTSELIIRHEEELEEWRISTKFQEERIFNDLDELHQLSGFCKNNTESELGWQPFETAVQQRFNKETQSCHNYYGEDCIFVGVCHGGYSLEDVENTLYQIRKPHHQLEEDEFKKKGFLK